MQPDLLIFGVLVRPSLTLSCELVAFLTGCRHSGGDGRQGGVGDARPQRVLHREHPAEPDQGRGRHLRGFQRGGALGQEGAAVA